MRRGGSNGVEDIDEFFFVANGVTVHIEKMDKNEYFIGIDAGEKTATMFIGHWPRIKRKKVNLMLNIAENNHGTWSY